MSDKLETSKLKKFAQYARRTLLEQVAAKLTLVLAKDSPARRESPTSVAALEKAIADSGKPQVIDRVAYTWFNRFCALRFMDVNRYNRINVVSPADTSQFQPELLAEAKSGVIDDGMVSDATAKKIHGLLNGSIPSPDGQGEAYRLLVVAACNSLHTAMPFLFERIEDYTELLMPDDLLSGNSILAYIREAMTPDACESVEVIGWLYQFYISEKKDQVFADLKKNTKISPDNIPAATQLFTPHWIVRYLVENSLGRLWLLNNPGSKLAEQMDYYIAPVELETDYLKISSPEEIKICDPACGSGHMLTYAFDLLYAIYEEAGYDSSEIPEQILTHNLYGIEIDERAGELAAFALTMKAAQSFKGSKQRRFFNKGIKPNICVLENIHFSDDELDEYTDFVGRDLFTADLRITLKQFEEADNFGSLIRPHLNDVSEVLRTFEAKDVAGQLFLADTHNRALQALKQADYLSSKYHVVVANPPYMGHRGMNSLLGGWAKEYYPATKTDLYSMFVERILKSICSGGFAGFMCPFTWMFLYSYSEMRDFLLSEYTLTSLIRPEYHAFFDSAYVPLCAFTIFVKRDEDFPGVFIDLNDFYGSNQQSVKALEAIRNIDVSWRYTVSASELRNIPGSPIAYWATKSMREAFLKNTSLGEWVPVKQGLATADNDRFIRLWGEVSFKSFGVGIKSSSETMDDSCKWYPYNKGGDFRKWNGNFEYVVLWENDGFEIRNFSDETGKVKSRAQNTGFYFKQGVTWTFISSSNFGARFAPSGSVFDVAGSTAFPPEELTVKLTAFLASKVAWKFLELLNPTLNFQVGNISSLPVSKELLNRIPESYGASAISFSMQDWNAYETSWDFTSLPLLQSDYRQPTLEATYQQLREHWRTQTLEMQRLEEENNRIFIEAYGLQDELTPEVPLKEITLTCNPHYRYGGDKTDDELEAVLLADSVKELISYAVGCMLGRYSLNKPGLILANQGETLDDYLKQVPNPSFPADDDNVIPILDDGYFNDDIVARFRSFLKVTFGEAQFETNLAFVEAALGMDVRKYFLKDFYNDHVKRYKKRPIYWLFSSPKGSFNALIYMHRYRQDTVSVVLNNYLRPFRDKLVNEKNRQDAVSISTSETKANKAKALKRITQIKKILDELDEYEHDVLYPLAGEKIEIDLDDGVKQNYPKFGAALKKIVGLDSTAD
ncbi:BREX-1 system adenine-specific DNA-methyltransferase PglX [Parathalassolituus penaei]|uniref:site-specific DNA-methyltransferase (adenine-specific) n=1 Tax=Parathalassolituus penaei TaxID=2997323 RepID=A0A9X3EGI7_9GAMM|nr:BREX-1 system adenine-specific DNA-methyltransferase PglX [Parathalassolituus penaei]MCY0967157.1 BREX-1 system adenine-specific DNA-methyltransferase PglX [Parathalassolituus penaei]